MHIRIHRGFTLLEAILALMILSSAFIACLQARTQLLATSQSVERTLQSSRDIDALLRMLTTGMLANPEVDVETGIVRWRGLYLEKEYVITREAISIVNPIAGQVAYPVPDRVRLYTYDVQLGEQARTLEWYE
ncbi:MAG: prepilin-type N-terminal cleavage/methylation domain-containing protein [Planctomycetota bacterium]